MKRRTSHAVAMRLTRALRRVTHFIACSSDVRSAEPAKEKPGRARRQDDEGFRNLPQLDESEQRHGEDYDGGNVDDGAPAEDISRSRDRPGRCRGDTVHERLDLRYARPAPVVGGRDDHEEIAGKEDAYRRDDGAGEARDEIAYESEGDDHGAGRDHRARHGVEELALVEPVEIADHAPVQERHDGEPASEDHRPGAREESEDLPE